MDNIVKEKKSKRKTVYVILSVPSLIHKGVKTHQIKRMIGKNTIKQAYINVLQNGLEFLDQKQVSQ